ncbi:MAG: hypothetical protein EON51_17320, partial [Acinetobacter sp.]
MNKTLLSSCGFTRNYSRFNINLTNKFVKCFSRLLLFVLLFLSAGLQDAFADGSKDLYPSGVAGNRAFLISKKNAFGNVQDNSYPYINLGVHYVYARTNEVIAAAFSARSAGATGGAIRITSPSGIVRITNNAAVATTGATTTTFAAVNAASEGGFIGTRASEIDGPYNGVGAQGNRYSAFNVIAPEIGIYKVEFLTNKGNEDPSTGQPTATASKADANWNQPTATTNLAIAAWDVSVRDGANWIAGRVYTTVQNLFIPANFSATDTYYGQMFVLTKDGVPYKVRNNGNNGIFFTFFVNNKGFVNASGNPIYKSFDSSSPANLLGKINDPRTADAGTNVTQKMFYLPPDVNLPTNGTTPDLGVTWLRNTEKVPFLSDVKFFGSEGTQNQVGSNGGKITFTSDQAGSYRIDIGGTATFPLRVLTGLCNAGNNEVIWDGRAGKAQTTDNSTNPPTVTPADPLMAGDFPPAGSSIGDVKVQLFGGEVHFPFIDMEIQPTGIFIERVGSNYSTVISDVVYWDDTDITGGVRTVGVNRTRFLDYGGLDGKRSTTNNGIDGHRWGNNQAVSGTNGSNTGNGNNSFGNEKSLDTWTYAAGNQITLDVPISVKIADLETVSISQSPNTVAVGDEVTYTVVVRNNNNSNSVSDVTGAKFALNFPSGLTGVTGTATFSNGTTAYTSTSSSTSYNSVLDLKSGETATYIIKGFATGLAPGAINVQATIMRPNDVTDP